MKKLSMHPLAIKSRKWRKNNPDKHNADQKAYRNNHREKVLAWERKSAKKHSKKRAAKAKEWRRKYPDKAINSKLKHVYGISLKDRRDMIAKQNGKCAICQTPSRLCIDHNHITDKVRGMLCYSCNLAIGLLHENITTFFKAVKYLKAYA